MRTERLTESRETVLDLAFAEAESLTSLGRRLASKRQWWRSSDNDQEDERTAIRCEPYGYGRWRVTVPNAIGVLRVGDVELIVQPKIPLPQIFHLFVESGQFPRIDTSGISQLDSSKDLWSLIAAWFTSALEQLIRGGLASGYRPESDVLRIARGRIEPAPTVRMFLRGVPAMKCSYEEFDVDTPLNRVLRAAAVAVAGSPSLDWGLRKRARATLEHLVGVGRLRDDDLREAYVDRQTARYADAITFARHVISSTGRSMDSGPESGYGFLIRTPEMVEEALRRIVARALADQVGVTKLTLRLKGSHHSLTPDLVFQKTAVGDVKYKVWDGDWHRSDLYQLVSFATGFGTAEALRVGFSTDAQPVPPIYVGDVALRVCDWPYDDPEDPAQSELVFSSRLRKWFAQVSHKTDAG